MCKTMALLNEKIHFIGAGGTGLSAIMLVLLEMGVRVSGSDMKESEIVQSLRDKGALINIGHDKKNLADATIVVRSSAIPETNEEVIVANETGIPVLKRIDFLKMILSDFDVIGVAGTHGKTTTTSMLVWVMDQIGLSPGFIVGGVVENLGVNARAGHVDGKKQSQYFVIEADEYDNMFHGLAPLVAVITNVEHDHPDCFPTETIYMDAFYSYIDRLRADGSLVVSTADENCLAMLHYAEENEKRIFTFGIGEDDSTTIEARNLVSQVEKGYAFDVVLRGEVLGHVALTVPGKHNVMNALAVLATLEILGIDLPLAFDPLQEFVGAGRRFDIKFDEKGVLLIDDYGHHPTEISVTLAATKDRYPGKKVWAVWQPHMYSRTLELLDRFEQAFVNADAVIVTDVFAAREKVRSDFCVDEEIVAHLVHEDARAICDLEEVAETLLNEIGSDDVVIVFSAGDAIKINMMLMEKMRQIV